MSTGCAALPPAPERGLYVDLRQVVASAERLDWVVDDLEVAALRPDIMRSACLTPPSERLALRGWVANRVKALGGPSAAAFATGGEDAPDLAKIQHIERVGLLLAAAEQAVERCPYWLAATREFAGVHADANRWVLLAETMPSLQILLADGADTRIGGAGLGRILLGRGVSHRLTLAGGFETGIASVVSQDDAGELSITPAFAIGLPMLLRFSDGPLRTDLGLAFTVRSPEINFDEVRYGVRWSVGVGVATLRVLGVQPYVMLWTGHEYQLARDRDPGQHGIRVGTRVGVNWDP